MAYALGAVKEHVKNAANHFGTKHGYAVVYGWRAVGSVPGSDHPKGLALDFMGTNRAKGDALVADLIANASAWNITYIIWQRKIWTRESGEWRDYNGPSPHTDHVHVSFGETAGSGIAIEQTANPLVPDWLESLREVAINIEVGFKWLADPKNWVRIGMLGAGFTLCLIAVIGWKAFASNTGKVIDNAKP